MAEDPRFLLHFKTKAKFEEKLADGTVSENRHLCFIKDEGLIWCRGKYYADSSKLDELTSIYNGWSIGQSNGSTLTITLTGKEWDEETREWKDISKTLTINPATQSVAGLLSATDKTKLDGLNTTNVSNITFGSNANNVTVTISKDNGNSSDTSTTSNLPAASSTSAGTMSSTDKIEHDRISTVNFALGAVTPNATTVTIAASKTNITNGSSVTNNITIPGATSTAAGVMSATDKTELDRISTTNFSLGAVTPTTTTVGIAASKTNVTNGSTAANNITIPAVTETSAGVMSSADKAKLNDINIPTGGIDFSGEDTDIINGAGQSVDLMAKFPSTVVTNITGVSTTTTAATINFTRSAKDTLDYNAATSNTVTIPGASTTAAGLMSSTDKTEHDRISTVNFTLGAVTPAASTVQIAASKTNVSNGQSTANNITLPAATSTLAGVMTAADKVKLDTTLPNQITAETTARQQADNNLQSQITSTANALGSYTVNSIKISTNPVITGANANVTGYTQPSTTSAITASDTINGALGKLERGLNNEISNRGTAINSLRTELSGQISTEITNRTNADSNLQSQINANKSSIDNYTINGFKVSTNPVIGGANINITGYSQPSATSALTASDTINSALGKLERSINNEISNRQSADTNLSNQLTSLKNDFESKITELENNVNNIISQQLQELQKSMIKTIEFLGVKYTPDSNGNIVIPVHYVDSMPPSPEEDNVYLIPSTV